MQIEKNSSDKGFALLDGLLLIAVAFIGGAIASGLLFKLIGGSFLVGQNVGLIAAIPTIIAGGLGSNIVREIFEKKHTADNIKKCIESAQNLSPEQIQTVKEVANEIVTLYAQENPNLLTIENLKSFANTLNEENKVDLGGYRLFCDFFRHDHFRWLNGGKKNALKTNELKDKVKDFIPELPINTNKETALELATFVTSAAAMYAAIAIPLGSWLEHKKEAKELEKQKPKQEEVQKTSYQFQTPCYIDYRNDWAQQIQKQPVAQQSLQLG